MTNTSLRFAPFSLGALLFTGACATSAGTPAGRTAPTPQQQRGEVSWSVMTREHIDLWLHGYALLTRDTSHVPVFRRGYRDRVDALKRQRSVLTQLDANKEKLQARLEVNPGLANGQFLPMYFASFDQMKQVISLWLQAQGDPRAAGDQVTQQLFAVLNQSFQSAPDRDWLRLFTQSLEDERTRFFHDFWSGEQNARLDVTRTVDSLWQATYRAKLQRYLANTQQEAGDFVLAITLGGEGRTINFARRQNAVAVGLPDRQADAAEAFYVFAHEVINAVTNVSIADNTTPAQQRAGLVAQYSANATVRGGAMLLQRVAPELVAGYMRYYLRQANVSAPSVGLEGVFFTNYPIPPEIRDAIARQLNVVLGGI